MTTDTVFDLASVTKVMATTFAVMLLVDAGELDLDATVTSYLPDFGDGEEPPATAPSGAGKQNITLRHLLTHRAGLYQWKPIYYRADNAELAYEYIRELPLAWPVGSGRHYSDLGFMLLERVVERVAGEPLDAFLHQRLYEPRAGAGAVGDELQTRHARLYAGSARHHPAHPNVRGDITWQSVRAPHGA